MDKAPLEQFMSDPSPEPADDKKAGDDASIAEHLPEWVDKAEPEAEQDEQAAAAEDAPLEELLPEWVDKDGSGDEAGELSPLQKRMRRKSPEPAQVGESEEGDRILERAIENLEGEFEVSRDDLKAMAFAAFDQVNYGTSTSGLGAAVNHLQLELRRIEKGKKRRISMFRSTMDLAGQFLKMFEQEYLDSKKE